MQYIPIADHGDPVLEPDYLPAHPALLKINGSVIETINPETHELAICGEIAGDLFYEIEDFLEKLWPAKNRVLREI